MTTRPTVTRAQLDVQEAAEAGKLSRSADPFYDPGAWRIDGTRGAVTVSATSLLKRGLIEEGQPYTGPDGCERIPAVLTDAGRALLEDFASREPAPKEPDADPS